ncbi:MAG TPA: Calx-beta domain-containing protein, partial [Vicinamibacteria bacterium]|nr:Calx-beta domain-containing protein [Vicinamibacteria bacterium]
TLSAVSSQTVTVNWATANGTAVAPGDYQVASGMLTFSPGTTTQPISVTVNGDLDDEANESFVVNLSVATNALIADAQGIGTIVDDEGAVEEAAVWTNVVGATASGASLTKTTAAGWTSGAVSTRLITSGDGYVECAATGLSWRGWGLGNGDSNQSYTDIEFGIVLSDTGVVKVFEGGTHRGDFGSYASGNRLRVAVEGGVVKYSRNGTVFYTSGLVPSYPLRLDTSLFTTGSMINDCVVAYDPRPSLSIGDVSVTEGDSGTTLATFPVTLSAASSDTVMVNYTTSNGTAVAGPPPSSSTFSNGTAITINDNASATPYPSTISVPSFTGTVAKVTVTLANFNHTYPGDVDVLLVGPAGQKVMLLSDVGSSNGVAGVTLVLDDAGPALGSGPIVSGTYRPTNVSDNQPATDVFGAPAPAGPYSSSLSAFAGADPVGTWSLYVVDDFGGDVGSFSGGWSLTLQTTGGDYQSVFQTLVFDPGTTALSASVTVNGDTLSETDETFFVTLSGASSNARIADGSGQGTILDDDGVCADTDGDRLTDCVETNTGIYISPSNTGTNPNNPDTDGDAIDDGDEVLGTTLGLNLPGMGASPLRKDIFLEYDWFDDALDCSAHSHRPTQAMVDRVTSAFAGSPVTNPDGSTGVALHHDFGQGGLFAGGNLIPDADGVIVGGVNNAEFQAHKAANFAANRAGIFHYVLLPHRYNTNSGSSGQAELPGNDLIVSLQCFSSLNNVSNTIMHELGHNLNLQHGGPESCNWKPNYNSVMNYRYQFPRIDTNCDARGDSGEGNVLSYSTGSRINLNENSLNENQGVCGATAIDWNGNAVLQSGIAYDLNRQGTNPADPVDNSFCAAALMTLQDSNDWAALVFTGLGDADGYRLWQEIIDCDNPAPEESIVAGP